MKRSSAGHNIKLNGIAASAGIAIGKVFKLSGDVIKVEERSISSDQIAHEVKKLIKALEVTKRELAEIQKQAKTKTGKEGEDIFDAHQSILEDHVVIEETIEQIKEQKKNADFIYNQVMQGFQDSLQTLDDEYFRGRVADIKDVKRRLIKNIQGGETRLLNNLTQKAVIIAYDLTPSDTVLLDRQKIIAFLTDKGGKTSHAAIMARSMGIPSVVGLENITNSVRTGDTVIIDGISGAVIVNPTSSVLNKFLKLRAEYDELTKDLSKFRNLPCRTLDGKDVELSANLDFLDEINSIINYGARGVGLFRTEYLYLKSDKLPTEEQEFAEYLKTAEKLYPHPVIIRTLDIGGDKTARCLPMPHEDNPMLGWRAIRICLENPKLFKSQLRAILRASIKGNVKLLLPMISSLDEIYKAKAIIDQVKGDLTSQNIPFDDKIEIGAMIEIPSAAIMADAIAEEVDFLSIGTNDLIQYTAAVDRTNLRVAHLYDRLPPAVLRLVKNVVDAGHRKGVWVGMCGEMAGDPLATLILLGLGLDELSVSPAMLLEVKKIIRMVTFSDSRKIAEKALQMKTSMQIERYIRNVMTTRYKLKIN
ncbi:phosphoenolpyruvate--protein phosphotransferase [candidate division KSB1 bacterium]|nr:phosphoenolpyruvate--protein phosphotransferase [candidate division KSB1 bacterium]MBL7093880.1 phosphoenolpyruvate--protein phosphotransferase [candidate division KSB1 bacterium]